MKLKHIVAAAMTAVLGQVAQAEPIRIATEGAYPPFNFVDESGELKGFDVDVANALCEKMQAECVIVAQAWDGMIPGLKAGKYDAIIASMSITEKRKQAVDFTRPYYVAGAILVGPKDSDIAFDADKIEGKAIGVQRASTYANLMAGKFPGAEVKSYDTVENHNLDLVAGRLDGVVAQRIFMYNWLKKEGAEDRFEFKGDPVSDPEYIGYGAGIAIDKSNPELLKKLDDALGEIMADGTYDALNAKYFPFSIKP